MNPSDDQKPDPAILRSLAEEKLDRPPVIEPLSAGDLLHELHVHQIELEMQNETLRKAQTGLEESRDRYVDLYDFAPVGYITLDSTGMIEEINLTASVLLGKERKNLLKRGFSTPIIAEHQSRWMTLFLALKEPDSKGRVEVTMHRGDGTVFPALLECAAQKAGAGGTELRIVLTDITERKAAEAQLASANTALALQNRELAGLNALLVGQKAALVETLGRVKRLEGLLSICMYCKKIRAENSNWHQLEEYISKHSDAVFSHGICPECLAEELKKLE
jgi:PAS domain S-box-containing protein